MNWESNPSIGECVEWGGASMLAVKHTIETKHGEVWKPTGVEGTLAEMEKRIVEIRRRVVLIRGVQSGWRKHK